VLAGRRDDRECWRGQALTLNSIFDAALMSRSS